MKYEPIFGDQRLFDGAPVDAEAVFKSHGGSSRCVYYRLANCHERFFSGEWVKVPSIDSQTFHAMRRIIPEPKRWTVEDQKAGRLPDVGVLVKYFANNEHDDTEVTAQWRSGDELEILRGQNKNKAFAVFNKRTKQSSNLIINRMKPIETPEEKAARLREEWCAKAAKTLKNLEYTSRLTSIYDALLSGELPMPKKEDE